MKDQFEKEIHGLAQQIKGLHDIAVAVYTPLVDDICSKVAPMKDVEWLLVYMFGFAGDERMLLLYRRVCRHYWETIKFRLDQSKECGFLRFTPTLNNFASRQPKESGQIEKFLEKYRFCPKKAHSVVQPWCKKEKEKCKCLKIKHLHFVWYPEPGSK